jgi:hypothetical protein
MELGPTYPFRFPSTTNYRLPLLHSHFSQLLSPPTLMPFPHIRRRGRRTGLRESGGVLTRGGPLSGATSSHDDMWSHGELLRRGTMRRSSWRAPLGRTPTTVIGSFFFFRFVLLRFFWILCRSKNFCIIFVTKNYAKSLSTKFFEFFLQIFLSTKF